MTTGAPKTAVTELMLTSVGAKAVRAMRSQNRQNAPPPRKQAGIIKSGSADLKRDNVRTMAVVCGAALILTFLLSKPLRAYQLGEIYAQNLGVPLRAFRAALILLSSVLSACVTAFAGRSVRCAPGMKEIGRAHV